MSNNSKRIINDPQRDQNTVDWINEVSESEVPTSNHLSPVKHPQPDFFIADIFDTISLQLDMNSMEHPLFALKAGDKKAREYDQNGLHG